MTDNRSSAGIEHASLRRTLEDIISVYEWCSVDPVDRGYSSLDSEISRAKHLLSLPAPVQPQTLGGTIAAVYGSLDAEDCVMVDREWARQRGYILPTNGTSTLDLAQPSWQPIETAPKDGTCFLVCNARVVDFINVVFCEPDTPIGERWATVDGPTYHQDAFTHWCELPDPPQEIKVLRTASISSTKCAWPNCDQPSGHDYCYSHCLADRGVAITSPQEPGK